jgi:tetratricopeptide (TPR) repeat protein
MRTKYRFAQCDVRHHSHPDSRSLKALPGLLLVALMVAEPVHSASSPPPIPSTCNQDVWDRVNTRWDYRTRDSSDQMRYQIADNWENHTGPAKSRMDKGEFTRQVMADLNFTLIRYPNHYLALEQLVRYAQNGGKPYEYGEPQCYFNWARQFASNDAQVVVAEAYFAWKTGNKQRAEDLYRWAMELDPQLVTAPYNLGLLYVELKQYDKAVEQAIAAYSMGYPLPGLRNRLREAGFRLPENAETGDAAERSQ